jgi:hypothetical protein
MSFMKAFISVISGLRKFTIMFVVLAVASGFRIAELLSGTEFIDLVKVTVVSYMSTNAAEHLTTTLKDWVQSKAPEVIKNKD